MHGNCTNDSDDLLRQKKYEGCPLYRVSEHDDFIALKDCIRRDIP
jgi:hypothetical protein